MKRFRAAMGDPILAFSVIGLTLFGIAMIYSAGQTETLKAGVAGAWHQQMMWLGISLVGMAIVTRIQVRWLEWIALPAYILAVAALAATLVVGTGKGTAQGTKSWLAIGPMMVSIVLARMYPAILSSSSDLVSITALARTCPAA